MIRREYRCFFEGEQEDKYFNCISQKIKLINPSISLKFQRVGKLKVLEESSTSVPKIAVFDYDSNKKEFENKVNICKQTKILYSNLNFDLWLLLHKKQYSRSVMFNDDYVDEIRKQYSLGETDDIKKEKNINKILDQIQISDVKRAIKNAEYIMRGKLEKDKIQVNKKFVYYPNPSMSIHMFFMKFLKNLTYNSVSKLHMHTSGTDLPLVK